MVVSHDPNKTQRHKKRRWRCRFLVDPFRAPSFVSSRAASICPVNVNAAALETARNPPRAGAVATVILRATKLQLVMMLLPLQMLQGEAAVAAAVELTATANSSFAA